MMPLNPQDEWVRNATQAQGLSAGDLSSTASGTKYDDEKPRLALVPARAFVEVGKVMTYGAKKYAQHNYLGGIAYLRLASAALRHLFSWISGEDTDPESGLPHLSHAAASLLMLIEMTYERPSLDDRFKGKSSGGVPETKSYGTVNIGDLDAMTKGVRRE